MNLQETKDYLDTQPGVLAVWWFIENVSDDNPDRQEIFFYLRERVRRYHYQLDRKDQDDAYKVELEWDADLFRMNAKS